MSALLAVVAQSVVATPVPSPSPQVVQVTHEVTKIVQAASPQAQQLMKWAELALLVVGGVGSSLLHQVFESLSKKPDGWSRGFNIFLQVLLGVVVAALSAYVNGELTLTWDSAIDFAAAFFVVLGSSQGRWAFTKWVNSLGTDSVEPNPVADPSVGGEVIPTKSAL